MEENRVNLLLIAGSAGALDALLKILSQLHALPAAPIVIILHRKAENQALLIDLLGARSPIPVKEADEKEIPLAGHLYVAPADYHLLFEADGSFSLDASEKVNYSRPSIDVSFSSAADVYCQGLACILLSGANNDGTEGMRRAKAKGAICIAQSPATAEVPFMPEQAIKELSLQQVYSPAQISQFINQL